MNKPDKCVHCCNLGYMSGIDGCECQCHTHALSPTTEDNELYITSDSDVRLGNSRPLKERQIARKFYNKAIDSLLPIVASEVATAELAMLDRLETQLTIALVPDGDSETGSRQTEAILLSTLNNERNKLTENL